MMTGMTKLGQRSSENIGAGRIDSNGNISVSSSLALHPYSTTFNPGRMEKSSLSPSSSIESQGSLGDLTSSAATMVTAATHETSSVASGGSCDEDVPDAAEGTPGSSGRSRQLERKQSVTCIAMRSALLKLYRSDDFVKEPLASGFFSEIYKVTHRSSGQLMVMKKSGKANSRASNLHEIELLNQLHHRNIVRFLGVCIEEGQLHALTEYINGGNLQDILLDQRFFLSWIMRFSLAEDIAEGMMYLNSQGFMHRDLTSKNILIRQQPNLKLECIIADLGLATKIPKNNSVRLPQVGTPYWIAPECLRGEFYNQKADVFSFGIIICEIIARITADPEQLPRIKNFGINEAAFRLLCPEDCPPRLIQLAFDCCKVSPTNRPTFKECSIVLNEFLSSNHRTRIWRDLDKAQRSRSHTCNLNVATLNSKTKKSRKSSLVRSYSDSGSRPLNIQRVSQRINPFDSTTQGKEDLIIRRNVNVEREDAISPTELLCNELSDGWGNLTVTDGVIGQMNSLSIKNRRRSNSLPSARELHRTFFQNSARDSISELELASYNLGDSNSTDTQDVPHSLQRIRGRHLSSPYAGSTGTKVSREGAPPWDESDDSCSPVNSIQE